MSSEGTMSAWERRKMYWKNIAAIGKTVETATSGGGGPEKVPASSNTSKPGPSKTADQKAVVKKTVKPNFVVPQNRPPKPAPSTSLTQVSRKPVPPVVRNRSMSVSQLNIQQKKHKLEGATNDLPNKRFKATPLPTDRRATLGAATAATRPRPVISRRATDVRSVVPARPAPPPRPKPSQQKTTPAAQQPVKRNYYAVPSRVETGLKRRQTQVPTFLTSKRLSIFGASAPQPVLKRGRNSAPLPVKAKASKTTSQPSAKPKLPKTADLEENKKNEVEQLSTTPHPDRRGSYTISRISEESGELPDQELEPEQQMADRSSRKKPSASSDVKGSEQQSILSNSKRKGVPPTKNTEKNQDQFQLASDDDISKENQTSHGRMTRARHDEQAEMKQTPVKNAQKAKRSRRANKELVKEIQTGIGSSRAATGNQEVAMLTRNGKTPGRTTRKTAARKETPKQANIRAEETQIENSNKDVQLEVSTDIKTPKRTTRMAAESEETPKEANVQREENQEGTINIDTQLATTTTKNSKTPKRTTRKTAASETAPKEANVQHEENQEGTINIDAHLATTTTKNSKTPKRTTRKTVASDETPEEANCRPDENKNGLVNNDTEPESSNVRNIRTPKPRTPRPPPSKLTPKENVQFDENHASPVNVDDVRPETSEIFKTTVASKRVTPKTPKSVLKRGGTTRQDNGLVQNQENVPPSKSAAVTPGKPTGTGLRRPKNVSFHMVPENSRTSVTLPKTPRRELSLREKLENFLEKKGCSVSKHRHLRCFGYKLSELRQNKTRPYASEPCTSENASPNLRMRKSLDKSLPSVDDTPVEESVVAILNELKTVLLMGQSVSEGTEWLKKLEECSPSVIKDQAAYWVVKALLEEQAGKYQQALEVFTQAVERDVQPFDELKQALADFTDRLHVCAKEVGVTCQDSATCDDKGIAEPRPEMEDAQANTEMSLDMSARRSGRGASQKRKTRSKALKNLGSPMEATVIKYTVQDASSVQSLSNRINVGSPNILAVITPIRRSVRLTRSSHRKTRRSFNLEELPESIQDHIARTPKAYI